MAFNPKNLVVVYQAGNPFVDDPADADDYYAMIGRIVVIWGRFEQMLEQTISMVAPLPDAPLPHKLPPVSLTRKLDRLKVLCRDTPSLNHLHEVAREFATSAALLAPRRHGLTHANWQGFSRNKPEPTVVFTNIHWDIGEGDYDRRPVPLSELETLLIDIIRLNDELFDKLFNEVARVRSRLLRKSSTPK